MSETRGRSIYISFPWLVMFFVVKLGGTALAHWSWWWVLLPVVPDLVVILRHFGMLG